MILVDPVPLPALLRLPEKPGKCLSDIQEIRRLLRGEDLKGPIVLRFDPDKGLPSPDEFRTIVNDVKWEFIKKDFISLASQIERMYHQKLDELGFNLECQPISLLYQIVEIPWTLQEPVQGNSTISYKILTKREIAIY